MSENIATSFSQVIEGLIFTSGKSISKAKLKQLTGLNERQLVQTVYKINKKYSKNRHAIRIRAVAGGYQMLTIPSISTNMSRLNPEKKIKFTAKVLQTLTIVAYQQPITKQSIDRLRGADSCYTIGKLLELRLIKIGGRAKSAGNPLLYKTSDYFLEVFGFESIADLPRVNELAQFI